jgi:hypothetical protein
MIAMGNGEIVSTTKIQVFPEFEDCSAPGEGQGVRETNSAFLRTSFDCQSPRPHVDRFQLGESSAMLIDASRASDNFAIYRASLRNWLSDVGPTSPTVNLNPEIAKLAVWGLASPVQDRRAEWRQHAIRE